MKREEIIQLANEALVCQQIWIDEDDSMALESVILFAKLVAAHTLMSIDPSSFMSWQEGFEAGAAKEREACAKVCEELAELSRISDTDSMWEWGECAAAIRARGNV